MRSRQTLVFGFSLIVHRIQIYSARGRGKYRLDSLNTYSSMRLRRGGSVTRSPVFFLAKFCYRTEFKRNFTRKKADSSKQWSIA